MLSHIYVQGFKPIARNEYIYVAYMLWTSYDGSDYVKLEFSTTFALSIFWRPAAVEDV